MKTTSKFRENRKRKLSKGRRFIFGFLDNSLYGPCPNCLEWIQKRLLRRHTMSCPVQTDVTVNPKTQSDVLTGRVNPEASEVLIKEVFSIMRNDTIGKIARTEKLIVIIGNSWMQQLVGNGINRKYYTSGIMRLTAKFLYVLREEKVYKQDGMEINSLTTSGLDILTSVPGLPLLVPRWILTTWKIFSHHQMPLSLDTNLKGWLVLR